MPHYVVNCVGGIEMGGRVYREGAVHELAGDEEWLDFALQRRQVIETDASGKPLSAAPVPSRLPASVGEEWLPETVTEDPEKAFRRMFNQD